jgi:hypothetical protein
LELLRIMTLSSQGGPRRSRLRSPNSFLVIFSSREVSGKLSSSSEDRSTTMIFSEDLTYSYTGDGGLRDETFSGETGGGEVLVGEGK